MTKLFHRDAVDTETFPHPKDEMWKYTNLRKGLPKTLTNIDENEITIHVKKGEALKNVLNFSGQDSVEHRIRLRIIVEENADLVLTEKYTGEGAYWTNMITDIALHPSARFKHIRTQEESKESLHTNIVYIQQDKLSCYSSISINKGAKMSRHDVYLVLQGEYAECTLNGLNILYDKQHADTTINVEHQVANCTSKQFYRSVLKDWSVGVFQSKSHVYKKAQKTNAKQMSNALLLSPTATMNTKPELEIYADDVECAHGATTGQLNEEQLFYLRSRGIPEEEATSLLVDAFIAEVLEGWGDLSV